ncbi:hypothetical protein AGMMS50268_19930 [Spirochaetia bacterium]|nr:hypothetical protein AGMMS50268_19930 [Spirochaetia bacterium]
MKTGPLPFRPLIFAAVLWVFQGALPAPPLSAQSGRVFRDLSPGGHRGAVSSLVYDGDRILSAGEDGFLEIWDIGNNSARERFQIGSYGITAMVRRPEKTQIACIESDGLGLNRISAWDYERMENIFSRPFRDPISYINYSASGNFLIAERSGNTALIFIDAETGELLRSPSALSGIISFAATGRYDRTMIAYSPAGTLSYWDIESGNERGRFTVPANMGSPLMFGNNRFFAGLDAGGLVILDAVTGNELDRNRAVSRRARLSPGSRDDEIVCLVPDGPFPVVYRFRMNSIQKLETAARIPIPAGTGDNSITASDISIAAAAGNVIALGTAGGELLLLDFSGGLKPMTVKKQNRITGAAASPSRLAFLTEDNCLAFIPLDFSKLAGGAGLHLENAAGYTSIAGVPNGRDGERFMLWQTGNTRSFPVIKSPDSPDLVLNKIPLRPLRSAAILDDRGLFLDSSGNITVVSLQTGAVNFSYSSLGSMDAAFLDKDNIILGRSALSGNAPFLKINIVTGETVPLPYDSTFGARLYRFPSGNIYAAAINQGQGESRTLLIRLNPANSSASAVLDEYQGEDTVFSIAEAGDALASTIGGTGASIHPQAGSDAAVPEGAGREMIHFERGPGIPKQLIGAAINTTGNANSTATAWFIAVDSNGDISWHDAGTGSILALFRLYENEWSLRSKGGGTVWGRVSR